MLSKHPAQRILQYSVPAVMALFLVLINQSLGMIQFGGMDGSALIQGAWRYALGQKVYADFVCTAPPIFVVPPGLMFLVFGPSWKALVTLGSFFTAGSFLVIFWMFRRMSWSFLLSAGFALAVECFTMIPLGWWGYNQLAQVAGVIFMGSTWLLIKEPASTGNRILYTLSLILLSWMKPNMAGFLIVAAFLVLLFNAKARRTALLLTLLGAAGSIGLMLLASVNPVDLLRSYFSASGRISNQFMFSQCIWYHDRVEVGIVLALLTPAIIALFLEVNAMISGRAYPVKADPAVLLGAAAMLGAVIGKLTNNDTFLTDLPLFFWGALMVIYNGHVEAACPKRPEGSGQYQSSDMRNSLVAASLCSLLFFSGIVAASRERIRTIGESVFFEHHELKTIGSPAFFKGVSAGPVLHDVLSELDEMVGRPAFESRPNKDVFFGPSLEFGYAAYNCAPGKGLFLWWPTPGEAKPASVKEVVKRFAAWAPKTCIFFHDNMTFMPQEILDYLKENYDSKITKNFTVLTRKS